MSPAKIKREDVQKEAHMEKNVWIHDNRLISISKSSTQSLPINPPYGNYLATLSLSLSLSQSTPPQQTQHTRQKERTSILPKPQTSNLKPQSLKRLIPCPRLISDQP